MMTAAAAVATALLCVGLTACDGPATPPEVTTVPAAAAPEIPGPVAQISIRTEAEAVSATAPFGMLRVAPAPGAENGRLVFGHSRQAGSPDVLFAVTTASAGAPGTDAAADAAADAADDGPGAEGPGPVRWSSAPGRLVGLNPGAGLVAEATTSGRVAFYRFNVTPGDALVLALDWRAPVAGSFEAARGRRAVTARLETPEGLQLHAAIRTDEDFSVRGSDGAGDRLELVFRPPDGVVQLRMALSTVDLAAARDNLLELDHWNFERARTAVHGRWAGWLERLVVDGEGAAAERLRDAWFRVLEHYGDLTDRDGRFRAPDGSIRRMPGGRPLIGNIALENEAALLIPLLSLLAPDVAVGLAETLLLHHRLTEQFPVATGWGFDTTAENSGSGHTTTALVTLAGLAVRGLPDLEPQRVLPAMLKSTGPLGGRAGRVSPGAMGILGYDRVSGPTVTLTLDESASQHALAVVAARLGDRSMAAEAAARGVLYRQLFDPQSGFFRARSSSMSWRSPFDPLDPSDAVRADYRDGSPWNALWTPARFDIEGLLVLLGGRQNLATRLDEYFEQATAPASGVGGVAMNPRALNASVPWIYAFSNRPDAGQPVIDRLRSTAADPADAGVAQAAWDVFANLGLYPVSVASGDYVLSRPGVGAATLWVAGGTLTIESGAGTEGQADKTLNDVPLTGPTVSHRRLSGGGRLQVSGDG